MSDSWIKIKRGWKGQDSMCMRFRNDGYDTNRIGTNLYISLDTGTYLPRFSKTQVDYTWLLLTCAKRASQHFDEHKK